MRDPGPLHHVVDADPVEPALLELDHAGLEQLAHGLPALRPQLAVLCGRAAAERRPSLRFARGRPAPLLRPLPCAWPAPRAGSGLSCWPAPGAADGRGPGPRLPRSRGTPVCLLRHSRRVAVPGGVAAITVGSGPAPAARSANTAPGARCQRRRAAGRFVQLMHCEAADDSPPIAADRRRGRAGGGQRRRRRLRRRAQRRRRRRERPQAGHAVPARRAAGRTARRPSTARAPRAAPDRQRPQARRAARGRGPAGRQACRGRPRRAWSCPT